MSNDEVKDYVKSVNDSTPDEPEYSRMALSEFVTLGTHHYFHLVTSNKVTEDSKIEINQNMFLEPRSVKFENGKIRKIFTAYVNYNCFTELNFEEFDSPNLEPTPFKKLLEVMKPLRRIEFLDVLIPKNIPHSAQIIELIEKYKSLQKEKEFEEADKIRNELENFRIFLRTDKDTVISDYLTDIDALCKSLEEKNTSQDVSKDDRKILKKVELDKIKEDCKKYLKSELKNIIKKEITAQDGNPATSLSQFLQYLDNYVTITKISPGKAENSPNELIKTILILLSSPEIDHAKFLKNIIIENCEKYLRIFLVCLYIFSNEKISIFIWNRFNQSAVPFNDPAHPLFEHLVPQPATTAKYIPSNFGNSNLDFQRSLFDYYEPPSIDEIFTLNQSSIEKFHKLIDVFNKNQDDKTQQLITSLLYFQSAIEGSTKYNMTNYLLVAACTDNIFTKGHKALNTRFGISQLHIYSLKVILKRLNDKNDFDLRYLMTDLRNDIAHGKIDYDTNLSFNNIDEDFRKLTEITKLILKYLIESTIGENKTSLNETINEIIDDAKKLAKEEHPEWSI